MAPDTSSAAPATVRGLGQPTPTERGALFGLGLYRSVTASWAVAVAIVDARSAVLVEPSVAFAILGPLLAWSLSTVWLARRAPGFLLHTGAQVIDITLGALVFSAEWFTYDGEHPLRLGAMWQLAPVMGAALRYGAVGGTAVGIGLGVVNAVALALTDGFEGRVLATASAVVLLGVAGAAAGAILDRLRHAEDDLAEARARERVARTLHDGVLQTLAVIQRRSDDSELVGLAAAQDRELRSWIRSELRPSGPALRRPVDLERSLRELAERLASRDGTPIEVVAVTVPEVSEQEAEAVVAAVAEALTNAAKHAAPTRITVFVDAEAGVLECSVTDDGRGFDPSAPREGAGLGIAGSMHAPIEALGGTVVINSRPGAGTEVALRLPLVSGARR